MSRLPPASPVCFDETGIPFDPDYGDSFYSRHGGLEETRVVFIDGCVVEERWQQKPIFIIAELGFGTGLNFLATLDRWTKRGTSSGWLHFISVEAMPMPKSAAAKALQAWPTLAPLSAALLDQWPVRHYGNQRLFFDQQRATLDLVIGDVGAVLPNQSFRADAWFLDGFSPAKNPAMWSSEVLSEVRRLSAPGAIAATYSAAAAVRAGLAEAGFDIERLAGFGRKKHRLRAHLSGPPQSPVPPDAAPRSAVVIGGGIAGAATTAKLRARGLTVTVIDNDLCGQSKASNNPLALVMPRLDRGNTREARFHRAAYVMAVQTYARMPKDTFEQTGILERPKSERDRARINDLARDPPLPPDWLEAVSDETSSGALHHLTGGIVYPDALRRLLLAGAEQINGEVATLTYDKGVWTAAGNDGSALASGDICVITAGPGLARLLNDPSIPLEGRHGQVSLLDDAKGPPQPLAGGPYVSRFDSATLFGATFDPWPLDQSPTAPTEEAHGRNLAALTQIWPEGLAVTDADPADLWGRTSVRVTTADRMPLAGVLPSGLGVVGALGSRGFTTALLCAETTVAALLNTPLPVDQEVAMAIEPSRFARRAAKRHQRPLSSTGQPA